MHDGNQNNKSKSETMFPPPSKMPTNKEKKKHPQCNITLPGKKCNHFMEQFKYLGSLISLKLYEDAEIASGVKNDKSLMENLNHFLAAMMLTSKSNAAVTCPLNTLLWGCKT
jgi:hypothetical protein